MNLGVFPGNLIGRNGQGRVVANITDDIQIGTGWLDHEDIRAFLFIEFSLTKGLLAIAGVKLIGTLVQFVGPCGGGAANRIPKWPVVGGSELCRIGKDSS